MKNAKSLLYFFLVSLFLVSCGDDDGGDNPNPTETFQAIAVYDSAAIVGVPVTLDASTSSGISGATVEWRFLSAPVGFDITQDPDFNSSEVTTSFTPLRSGSYSFLLTITKGNSISTENLNIDATGILEITDFSDITILSDVETASAGTCETSDADYIINSVVPITNPLTIQSGVKIIFGPNGGLDIQTQVYMEGFVCFAASEDNWKGIHINGGSLSSVSSSASASIDIEDGGNASFTSDPDQAAAIYVSQGYLEASRIDMERSVGYAIYFEKDYGNNSNGLTGFVSLRENTNLMRVPATFLEDFQIESFDQGNAKFEVFHNDRIDVSIDLDGKVLTILDSLLTEGFEIADGTIIMEPGAELQLWSQQGAALNDMIITASEVESERGGGVYCNQSLLLENTTVENQGLGFLPGLQESAAVYSNNTIRCINSIVQNNTGSGIYGEGGVLDISGSTFSNNSTAHIKTPHLTAANVRSNNTFDNASPAVYMIENSGAISSPFFTWNAFTNDAYYYLDADVNLTGYTLLEGVHIKVASNRYIRSSELTAIGTANDPIIIEGDINSRGYWQGILLEGEAELSNVQIKDAGNANGQTTFGTQFGANLVVGAPTSSTISVTNCEITNSNAFGVVIKLGATDYGINDPASMNTLEGSLGGFFDEN